ncbi:TetR/AcrR family transcriptional regulator [Kitasatospora sp. NBC_01287]|uniref:TetR/AcrR family transcriptional regulator n=1 Tax=Kitasatospora sp. NBC_01287 TaxID=2903573 RepID=UPI00224E8D22|nr:TetR/AcrR family transcriptional regulator [Kitasatospora sp. NBC_01287]MCX4750864.1 TetR/AcrR family transcriptional regulator [Kitasatospora sp. NBC_01287]
MSSSISAVDRLTTDPTGRQPRADARRNVARLVVAARTAIAELGVDASAHEIAARAGVGVGTFYRRIPSREALLLAVLDEVLGEMIELADRALAEPDPWQGLSTFAAAYVGLRTESCGIGEALGGACGAALEATLAALRERFRLLVERAQEAGAMRRDLRWQDVPFLLASVAATGERTVGLRAGGEQWRRTLQVLLDGLRTGSPTPPPGVAPS